MFSKFFWLSNPIFTTTVFFFFHTYVDDFHFSPLAFISSHPFPWFPPITGMQKIVKSASPFVSLFFNSNYIYSNEFVKTCPACSDITLVQHGWTDFRAFLSQHVWFTYLQVFWWWWKSQHLLHLFLTSSGFESLEALIYSQTLLHYSTPIFCLWALFPISVSEAKLLFKAFNCSTHVGGSCSVA